MSATTFEEVLAQVGDEGRHQQLLYWLFVIPINFLIPWMALAPIFLASTPAHWCHVPGRPSTLPPDHWKVLTLPREDGGGGQFSSCLQYNVTSQDVLQILASSNTTNLTDIAAEIQQTYGVTGCQAGWQYDGSDYSATLATRENWVCGREAGASEWMSVGMAGNAVGTLIFNSLSDIVGRKPVLAMTMSLYVVFGVARLYVHGQVWLMVTMFLASTSFPPILEIILINVLEQVSASMRARITSMSFLLWTAGMCLLPLLAWLTRDWQLLGLVTTTPFLLFLFCWSKHPESPRWVLSQGKVQQCAKLMCQIAHTNSRPVPANLEETLSKLAQEQAKERNLGALQLCKYPLVRWRTVLLTASYTFNNFFYYSLTYNMKNVSGNEFLNFFLISASELPSNLLGWWGAQMFGRRWTAVAAFSLASLFSLVAAFVEVESTWLAITLVIVSKLFITTSFMIVYVQCAEIYPTTHRGCGTGLSSLVSSCVGVTTPYVSLASTYGAWVPYVIIALVGMAGGVCASLLPETLDTNLPQTLLEANKFLASEKFWGYRGRVMNKGRVRVRPAATGETTSVRNKELYKVPRGAGVDNQ